VSEEAKVHILCTFFTLELYSSLLIELISLELRLYASMECNERVLSFIAEWFDPHPQIVKKCVEMFQFSVHILCSTTLTNISL